MHNLTDMERARSLVNKRSTRPYLVICDNMVVCDGNTASDCVDYVNSLRQFGFYKGKIFDVVSKMYTIDFNFAYSNDECSKE